MKKINKSSSILRKINITNSIVITTACVIIFLCFWFINYRMMILNEQQVIDNSMRNSVSILDDKLKDMSRVSLVCYSDDRIQEIMKSYEKYNQIQKVNAEDYLRGFYSSLITIRDDIAGVYLFTQDQLIYYSDYSISSVNRSHNVSGFLKNMEKKYGNQNGEQVRLISNEQIPFIRYKPGESSAEYLYMFYPVKAFSPNVRIGYIMLSISKNKVRDMISVYMKENSRFWLSDENGNFVLGTGRADEKTLEYMNSKYTGNQIFPGNAPLVSVIDSEYSSMKMTTVTSLDEIQKRYWNIIKIMIFLLTVMNLFVITAQSILMKERLKPLRVLASFMQRFSEKNIYGRIPVKTQDEIGKLTQSFNYMMDVMETLIEKEYKHKEMLQQAEINQQKISMLYLKNQINPHFLYNTLDMIRTRAQLNGDREVADIIMQLVEFYRLNVKADKQIVTVRHEVLLLQKYMNIMHHRYPNLEFSCDIEDDLLNIPIPNFLIQPLVENSLLHGLKNARYEGLISVSISQIKEEPEKIQIVVSDNGVGMSEEEVERMNEILRGITENSKENVTDRIGIENIQKRLQIYYPNEGNIRYAKNLTGGVSVYVTLMRRIEITQKSS